MIKNYLKRAFVMWLLLALLPVLNQCDMSEMEPSLPTLINNIELKDNLVNVQASRPLQAQTFILTAPLRLVVYMENAELAANVANKGEGSGELVKSWTLDQQTIAREAGAETKTARLTIELAKNITYQVTTETFGLALKLEEVKKAEEEAEAESKAIPKEFYPEIQKLAVSPSGQPSGQAVVPITQGDEKEARKMLSEIATQRPVAEKLPAARLLHDLTYKSQQGTFEAVMTVDGEFKNYKLLSLDLPLRVAIDFYGVKSKLGKKVYQVNTGRIKQIRVGTYPDKTRFVIELTGRTIKDARVVSQQRKMIVRIIY